MAGRHAYIVVNGPGNHIFIDGQGKSLADMDVVKRPVQVVQGDVVNGQDRGLNVLVIRQRPGPGQLFGRNRRQVRLIGLIGGESRLRGFIESKIDAAQARKD